MKSTFYVQLDEMTKASADGKYPAKRQLTLVEIGEHPTVWQPSLSLSPEEVGAVYQGSLGVTGALAGKQITVGVKRIYAGKLGNSFRLEGVILAIGDKPTPAAQAAK